MAVTPSRSRMDKLYDDWRWEQERQYEVDLKFWECYRTNHGKAVRTALNEWEEGTYTLRMQLRDVRLRLIREGFYDYLESVRKAVGVACAPTR